MLMHSTEFAEFFRPTLVWDPRWGNPLEFGDEIWRQKTRVLGLPDDEEIMPLAFFVLTQYQRVTDGQTDGWARCDHYYPR